MPEYSAEYLVIGIAICGEECLFIKVQLFKVFILVVWTTLAEAWGKDRFPNHPTYPYPHYTLTYAYMLMMNIFFCDSGYPGILIFPCKSFLALQRLFASTNCPTYPPYAPRRVRGFNLCRMCRSQKKGEHVHCTTELFR